MRGEGGELTTLRGALLVVGYVRVVLAIYIIGGSKAGKMGALTRRCQSLFLPYFLHTKLRGGVKFSRPMFKLYFHILKLRK